MTQPEELTILRADLIDQTIWSWTDLHGGDSDHYPVLVWQSRRLDEFERHVRQTSAAEVSGL